jgi:hypothetical protein
MSENKHFGKGIPLAGGFDLGAELPLDSRYVVDTMQELVTHIQGNRAYEGMQVYVTEKRQVYVYSQGTWMPLLTKPDMQDYLNEEGILEDCYYTGYIEPNDEKIWFFPANNRIYTGLTYENPVVDEIFAAIRTLQKQVQKLQSDVEYLKTHGGRPPEENEGELYFALEDGGMLLTEEGAYFVFEQFLNIQEYLLTLEDGASFLLEDGGCILLEETIRDLNNTLILLENGAQMLLENGGYFLTEN